MKEGKRTPKSKANTTARRMDKFEAIATALADRMGAIDEVMIALHGETLVQLGRAREECDALRAKLDHSRPAINIGPGSTVNFYGHGED